MAWRRPGDKPLSEPMLVRLPMHICVTRRQWVKESDGKQISICSGDGLVLNRLQVIVWTNVDQAADQIHQYYTNLFLMILSTMICVVKSLPLSTVINLPRRFGSWNKNNRFNYHTVGKTKLLPFRWWHFLTHFLVWKLIFYSNFPDICPQGFKRPVSQIRAPPGGLSRTSG